MTTRMIRTITMSIRDWANAPHSAQLVLQRSTAGRPLVAIRCDAFGLVLLLSEEIQASVPEAIYLTLVSENWAKVIEQQAANSHRTSVLLKVMNLLQRTIKLNLLFDKYNFSEDDRTIADILVSDIRKLIVEHGRQISTGFDPERQMEMTMSNSDKPNTERKMEVYGDAMPAEPGVPTRARPAPTTPQPVTRGRPDHMKTPTPDDDDEGPNAA